MSRKIVRLTLDHLAELPGSCASCLFWEADPVRRARVSAGDAPEVKEAWVSEVLREWGSCGRVALVDDVPVGHAIYAPAAMVPGAAVFPTAPVSSDAVLLTSMGVESDPATDGLQHELVARVVAELIRRGVRALEAFGRTTLAADLLEAPAVDPAVRAAVEALGDCSFDQCMIAADFLQEVGFVVVSPHPYFPRLRLELTKGLGWKAEVEAALERLLESSQLEQPVGAGSTISAQPAGG